MRLAPSLIEQKLWFKLRARRFNGVKFSRQVVVGSYIADFVCRSQKLVVELDGESHAGNEAYDAQRTRWLESKGYRVIRFANNDVMNNLDGVLDKIAAALRAAPLPGPLPEGEREHG